MSDVNKKLRDARIVVIDTETTGFDPQKDHICEVGYCSLGFSASEDRLFPGTPGDQLINPGVPIPPEASAVHHITDRILAKEHAPRIFDCDWSFTNVDLLVAHNAPFDREFCELEGVTSPGTPWLCTYRLARHVYPDAPNHKNQTLRYFLGFECVEGDAHRAGHDAEVTALILCKMLNTDLDLTIAEVIKFAESPVFLSGKMGFGKHHDKTWLECPLDYLSWMQRQGSGSWDVDAWFTLNEILAGRGSEHAP